MPIPTTLEIALKDIFHVVFVDEPLSGYTTIGVGGPAERLVIAERSEQLVAGLGACRDAGVPCFVMGWGRNLIVSDRGLAGVVIQNRSQSWQVVAEGPPEAEKKSTAPRLAAAGADYYQADDLQYSEAEAPRVVVQIDSGAKIDPLIKSLLHDGITGLQWFAGIPATVGGAIYMNMHGGYHFLGDLVAKALLWEGTALQEVDHEYFRFGYDWSALHENRATVIWAQLRLFRGDVERARATAREWARRKALQPQRSAGCIFRNLTSEEQAVLQIPTPSIGYVVEHLLQLKGERRGDAVISPRHAAFIENLGHARAAEVKELIDLVRDRARSRLGLELKTEVEFVGDF